MMASDAHSLLSLVRSALWSVPAVDLPDDVNWERVISLASRQTLLGLVADAVGYLQEDRHPPKSIMTRLFAGRAASIRAHALINRRLGQVQELLCEKGLRPVLLKGQGLAMNYPDPLARQCGDIDLYIGKIDCRKAYEIIVGKYGTHDYDTENSKHYHVDCEGVTVELHKIAEYLPGPAADRKYQEWTMRHLHGDGLRQVEIEGVTVELPPVAFDSIYVLNHIWHHFINGVIGLRQVCDWTMYLHRFHEQIDVVQLERDLRDFSMMKVWHLFAGIAVDSLGLPADECPLYEGKYADKSAAVLKVILDEGNFGYYSKKRTGKKPEGYVRGKLHTWRVVTSRLWSIFMIYPSAVIKYYFSYISNGVISFFKGLDEER